MKSYTVVQEWDGCWMADLVRGNEAACKAWMREHWRKYNKGKATLGLRDDATGRMVSFIL